jgi:ribosomal protein S6--L-glutamate ligase
MTDICIGHKTWEIELTLVDRDIMGFRMLLGRQAMRGDFLVDPGKSYVLGKGKIKRFKNKK